MANKRNQRIKRDVDLIQIYNRLFATYGFRNWWPADSSFEVIIGAILTQNVSWSNTETAINNLKSANFLDFDSLRNINIDYLASLIKSSRFYNQKAQKIKNFLNFLSIEYQGDLSKMREENISLLREKLLQINGFGEETVDSIILYACELPIFVIDNYTMRIFSRYGYMIENAPYRDFQLFFMDTLPRNVKLYNDYHAQIVYLGKSICKKDPLCVYCPIRIINDTLKCRYGSRI